MVQRPVFVATHPRACSTAFERVFMTRRDRFTCVHEPFGDAFYFGPERLGTRYENDEKARQESGFSDSTYKTIFDKIMEENTEGKRIFIKDITHYLVPPEGRPASLAPSLCSVKRGVGTSNSTTTNGSALKVTSSPVNDAFAVDEDSNVNGEKYPYPTLVEPGNPTVIPQKILEQFHFAFLIRHPKHSIPSYWRCTIPPLDEVTGFYNFMPAEAGYDEQRRVFDYLRSIDQIGPEIAADQGTSRVNGHSHDETKVKICVIDADEMLENPRVIMRKFCESVGIDFDPGMLEWDTPEDHTCAREAFEKWKGFHEDAINSSGLHARDHKKPETTPEQDYECWKEKYGDEAAKVIKETVEKNLADYEHMKKFAIRA